MLLPTLLDTRIDLALSVGLTLAAPVAVALAGRLPAGPRMGVRVAAALLGWCGAAWLAPHALPPIGGVVAWMGVFLAGFVAFLLVVGVSVRRWAAGLPQRGALLPAIAYGLAMMYVGLGAVPVGFHAARAHARLAFLSAGGVPTVALDALASTESPLVRSEGATCRSDVVASWTERRQTRSVRRDHYAVVPAGWTPADPIHAWAASCPESLDLLAVEHRAEPRLVDAAGGGRAGPTPMVVAPLSAGDLARAALSVSATFRSLLAAAAVAGVATWRLFSVRPGEPAAGAPAPPPAPPATGVRPAGPGWPGRNRRAR